MIIFDQLRLSDDGKRLYVNVHVNEAEYFKDIYLDKIVVKTGDKVLEATTPELYSVDEEGNPVDALYVKTFEGNMKEAALVLTANDCMRTWEKDVEKINFKQADMRKTLFFVYVRCKGTLGECTPCGLDEMTTVGVTFDEKLLYQRVMDYTKQLADDCNIPIGFIDFILLWNAFKASIETDHYVPAIKYWNMLFDFWGNGSVSNDLSKRGGCGCHG